MLTGKTVLIGITGGIAAYKICELIRMFKRANADVHVICTPNALNFVTKLTLQNLSQTRFAQKNLMFLILSRNTFHLPIKLTLWLLRPRQRIQFLKLPTEYATIC